MNYMKIVIFAATLHAFTSEMSERKKHLKSENESENFCIYLQSKIIKNLWQNNYDMCDVDWGGCGRKLVIFYMKFL